ncbi:MAG: hypothetical protein Q8Q49_00255 [bacterium]|nr:hypothetical protein [bacterium]
MNLQNNKRFLFLLIGIAFVLIIAIVFVVISLFTNSGSSTENSARTPTPTVAPYGGPAEIMRLSPSDNEKFANQLQPIVIFFRNAPPLTVSLSFSPPTEGTYTRDGTAKTITFTPKTSFKSGATYSATLTMNGSSFTTPSKTTASSYRWSFTIGEQQGEAGFSTEEQKRFGEILKQSEKQYEDRKKRLPFVIYMPYETDHFIISISASSDTVTITTYGNTQSQIDSYQAEARSWLQSHGGNLQTLSIVYINRAR